MIRDSNNNDNNSSSSSSKSSAHSDGETVGVYARPPDCRILLCLLVACWLVYLLFDLVGKNGGGDDSGGRLNMDG